MLFTKEYLTEKGFLKRVYTDGLRDKAVATVLGAVDGAALTPEGKVAKLVGTTEDGRDVFVTFTVVVGYADPFAEKVAKEKAPVEVLPVEL